jgi:HK97 family phage major capsid protein
MATIQDLLAQARTDLDAARRRRKVARDSIQALVDGAQRANRSHLTADEDREFTRLLAERTAAGEAVERAQQKVEEYSRISLEEGDASRLASSSTPTPAASRHASGDRTVRVGGEPRTYRSPAERGPDGGPSFLTDLFKGQVLNDPGANARLERHGREVEVDNPAWAKRAIGSGAVSGFVPPQYLSELFAEFARAGRPAANLCTRLPLPPEGMTLNVPRLTTSTATAVQATEGGAIGNQDPDDTLLAVPVVTVAGYVDVSRQAVERGDMVEGLLFADLAADYNAKLDAQVINGSGASGQHLGVLGVSGINSVTYTDATPTISELWPKLADSVGKVISQRFTGPTAMVSHPNLWAWLLAERDTTGRPMFEPSSVAFNPLGTTGAMDYQASSQGRVLVPFVSDGNVPTNLGAGTNETRVIVADFRDVILFEDESASPAQLRFDAPLASTLQCRLVAYGYSALASGRQPKAISVVSGTGLIVPAL